jgi:hypothetical protein
MTMCQWVCIVVNDTEQREKEEKEEKEKKENNIRSAPYLDIIMI